MSPKQSAVLISLILLCLTGCQKQQSVPTDDALASSQAQSVPTSDSDVNSIRFHRCLVELGEQVECVAAHDSNPNLVEINQLISDARDSLAQCRASLSVLSQRAADFACAESASGSAQDGSVPPPTEIAADDCVKKLEAFRDCTEQRLREAGTDPRQLGLLIRAIDQNVKVAARAPENCQMVYAVYQKNAGNGDQHAEICLH